MLLGGDKKGFWVRLSHQGHDIWLLQYAAPDYSPLDCWSPTRFGDMGWSEDSLVAYLAECGIRWVDDQQAALVEAGFFAELPD